MPAGLLAVGMLAGLTVWRGAELPTVARVTTLMGTLAWWWWRRRQRSAFSKGHIAERQVGRALEMATTAKRCAVAHNVTGIMNSGDIDHIVATPRNVWVIETKFRRVRTKRFSSVLSRRRPIR